MIQQGPRALAEYVRTDLAVFRVVAFALVGALLAEVGVRLGEFLVVAGVANHEAGVQAHNVRDVPTELNALAHSVSAIA